MSVKTMSVRINSFGFFFVFQFFHTFHDSDQLIMMDDCTRRGECGSCLTGLTQFFGDSQNLFELVCFDFPIA